MLVENSNYFTCFINGGKLDVIHTFERTLRSIKMKFGLSVLFLHLYVGL